MVCREGFSVGWSGSTLRSLCSLEAADDARDWAALSGAEGRAVRLARRGRGTCGMELTVESG